MSASVELVCVDPNRVHEFWPYASGLICEAVERTNLCDFAELQRDILEGKSLLWIVWNGQTIEAATTTSLNMSNGSKACIITACGGLDRTRWLPLLQQIETYAKNEGCACVRIYGRKGWSRVLDGYHERYVILERPL